MSKRYTLSFPLLALLLAGMLSACTAAPPGDNQNNRLTVEPTGEATAEATEAPTQQATEESFPVTLSDVLGNEVTLTEKPMRIVSVTLSTDEILLEMVGPDRLIGVTHLASDALTSNIADHPALAEVENTLEPTPNPEQIIAMEPDLVLVASYTDPAVIEQLQGVGLPVFAIDFASIADIQQNILTLGELVGEIATAQQMVETMNDRLAAIEEAVSQAEGGKTTVLYLSGLGWVAGSATTLDDIIRRAGGVNAAVEAGLNGWNQVNEETLIQMNPDVVIISPHVTDEEFRTNPVFAELSAIQNERVYAPSDAHMSAASQYIVLGVEELAKLLYPDLFPAE